MLNPSFWKGKKVFLTGHTGFKGTWTLLWLHRLGAEVAGYALAEEENGLFKKTRAKDFCISTIGDISDYSLLQKTMNIFQPDIVIHMAAQPLVRHSYREPIHTFTTNVIGTLNVLEAARYTDSAKVIINVTSDKVYRNLTRADQFFKEEDALGGSDPYSSSKACSELISACYERSYFKSLNVKAATVRAGNVIGGGDWSEDRLFPDMMRAYLNKVPLTLRNLNAVRPWQHVLDPVHGYLLLAEKLWNSEVSESGGWNFGPEENRTYSVLELFQCANSHLNNKLTLDYDQRESHPYEASILQLDSRKSIHELGWKPKLPFNEAVMWTVQWYNHHFSKRNMREFTMKQLADFEELEEV